MAGVLGRLSLTPPEDLGTIIKKLSVYEEAINSISAQGLTFAQLPQSGYRGEMSSLDDEQLGDLLNNSSSYCAYMDSEFAKAVSQHRVAEEILRSCRANVRIALKSDEEGRKFTVQDKDDRVENDSTVADARRHELFYFVRREVLNKMRETAQKNWDTVSRHVTIRGQEVERMRRGENVAGTPLRSTRAFRR
jgi:hypothetical protein